MKKILISALINIFFLEKISKKLDEKTKRASLLRTFIYFSLTVIFAIFFYRSSQVSTITNWVGINSLRAYVDSLHQPIDTIESLVVRNKLKTLGSYKNPYDDQIKAQYKNAFDGGVQILLNEGQASKGVIKDRDCFTEEIRREIEGLTGKPLPPYTGAIYDIEFSSNSIPSFIPYYPVMRYDKPVVNVDTFFTTIDHVGNMGYIDEHESKIMFSKADPSSPYLLDGLIYNQTTINHCIDLTLRSMTLQHSLVNTLNIFSACDLSQYTYILGLESDLHIKNLVVVYNVPIEVCCQDERIIAGANNFGISDSQTLSDFKGLPLAFLVKFPSMENLQQIRSLVLTAIVSALLSLLFTNLFYLGRKYTWYCLLKRRIRIKEWVKENEDLIKNVRYLLCTYLIVILTTALVLVCLGALGITIFINFKKAFWSVLLSFISIFVFIPWASYFLHKDNFNPSFNLKDIKMKLTLKIKDTKMKCPKKNRKK